MFWLEQNQAMPTEWFAGAPTPDQRSAWVGNIYRVPLAHHADGFFEVVPFVFSAYRYLMYFASLAGEVPGDDEQEVRDFIRTWAHDFEPDMRTSRLVKFMRADAISRDHIYEPASWRLDNPRQIFSFGQHLLEIVVYHSRLVAETRQYFYKPAPGLGRFYDRVCHCNHLLIQELGFSAIHNAGLEDTGYIGYEKQR
ncbi:hypothetical protein [Chromobacterium rhizoryzae]|uniref:hypothetical protein n=1 Tax=Chromobacterium rhizoryzae TaxID=1778675 RepID=UPI001D0821AD|nr:hypothetical protein [Chromobacterium rhizoryzae]